ncbi:major capsid protein [Clostridium beijerinckii]|uniref:major capsid protein n=1 Tax=Clostridium beijerinckii TaxID=1520 RepID=UPI001361B91A|nr:major capsid protein [Clostridium beijerinckii]MZK53670.1 major capsid protein [Clostridium beijerinckii]MZK61799.1 major capsid protein [Clostridium beijerinckii]MZK71980.1 major capsid protein [Clostridium beijerinckii]MZK77373.1 major capsid protein [Clostridium beijerinckii]MZK86951.1 major capsid protein [Clostridium beijerinckii]
MINLQDYINSQNIALYIKELPVEDTIDRTLFPNKKVLGTKLEQAKGAKQKAVALRQSTFDVAAKLRSLNAKVDITTTEIPFFKEAVGIDETTRREIINAMNCNNENIVNAVLEQVFEGQANLIRGAEIIAKRMRAQALQTGRIVYSSDPTDGNVVVDYGVPSNHKVTLTGTDKWTDPSADIVGDVKAFQKVMTNDNCPKPNILLMTEKTFDETFVVNTAISDHIRNSNVNTLRILGQSDYVNFAKLVLGLTVVFLEDTTYYPYEGAAPTPYYEDYKVTFMSGTTLGITVYGTTPEEFDLTRGSGKLDTTIVGEGTAVTTMVKEDPVTVDTKVSVMPIVSFDRADEVFFATVG